jgi:thiol-disulfide isomerase/thioredoxin
LFFLTAAVVLVGALCLVDLLLTFGVIRRLREHTTTLEGLAGRRPSAGHPALIERPVAAGRPVVIGDAAPIDKPVGDFTAWTVDGERVSPDLLVSDTVAVFLAPECTTCRAKVPDVVRWAGDRDRQRTLVVIDARVTDPADLVEPLSTVARVVVETAGIPVTEAFGATAFPSYCVVDDGKVIASSLDLSTLPVPAART